MARKDRFGTDLPSQVDGNDDPLEECEVWASADPDGATPPYVQPQAPAAGKQERGSDTAEAVPPQWLNYLFNRFSLAARSVLPIHDADDAESGAYYLRKEPNESIGAGVLGIFGIGTLKYLTPRIMEGASAATRKLSMHLEALKTNLIKPSNDNHPVHFVKGDDGDDAAWADVAAGEGTFTKVRAPQVPAIVGRLAINYGTSTVTFEGFGATSSDCTFVGASEITLDPLFPVEPDSAVVQLTEVLPSPDTDPPPQVIADAGGNPLVRIDPKGRTSIDIVVWDLTYDPSA